MKTANERLNAIIDTGSYITCINEKYVLNKLRIDETETRAGGMCNEPCMITGKTKGNFNYLGKNFNFSAEVVRGLVADLLLGLDFLKQEEFIINLRNDTLEFGKGENIVKTKINVYGTLENINACEEFVCMRDDCYIAPKKSKNVTINVSHKFPGKTEIENLQYFGWKTGVTVKQINNCNNLVTLQIKNHTHTGQKIFKNQRICKIKNPDENHTINNLNKKPQYEETDEKLMDNEGVEIDINPNLSVEQMKQVKGVLKKHLHLFTSDPLKVGIANIEPYKITLVDNTPVASRGYKLSPFERREMKKLIDKLLDAKILRRSSSPYATPCFLKKKDEHNFRFLCNFIKVNEKILNDRNAVPRTDNIFMALEGNKFFSTLDANQGFFQIPICEEDKFITAIIFDNELFEFNVLPQGLKISPAAFSKAIYRTFSDIMYEIVVAYMDDICTYGKTFEHALENLKEILERLSKLNLKLKTGKCKFMYNDTKLLGHKIDGKKVFTIEKNIEKIKKFPIPRTVKKVRSFLGLTGYYRKFIKNYAKLAWPLTNETKGNPKDNHPVTWNDELNKSFEKLKESLTAEPVLAIYKEGRDTILEIDGSSVAVGAVLSQVNERKEKHPVAYFSKKLLPRQKSYCAYDLELTALVEAVTHFREYLYGQHFVVLTDHAALVHFRGAKQPNARLARMVEKLSDYDFEIKHIKGAQNVVPDTLSRTVINITTRQQSKKLMNEKNGKKDVKGKFDQIGEMSETNKKREKPKNWDKNQSEVGCEGNIVSKEKKEKKCKKMKSDEKIEKTGTKVKENENKKHMISDNSKNEGKNNTGECNENQIVEIGKNSDDLYTNDDNKNDKEELLSNFEILNLEDEQKKDKFCNEIILAKSGFLKGGKNYVEKLKKYAKSYIIEGKILKYKLWAKEGIRKIPLIPKNLQKNILIQFHDKALGGGHFGMYKTLEKIKQYYFWPGIRKDVKNYIKNCERCQKTKVDSGKKFGLLKPIPVEDSSPLAHLELDFVGKLPESSGKNYVLVGSCRSTRYSFAKATKSADADSVIKMLHDIITTFGIPKKITTDRGTHFVNKKFRDECDVLGIKLYHSTTYSPQTQGGVERFNRTLKNALTKYVHDNPNSWTQYLPYLIFTNTHTP